MSLPVAPKQSPRRFHQASWDEPIVFELSTPGERGVLVTPVEPAVREAVGDVVAALPEGMRRPTPPALPEIAQMRVLKHYLRLSQENLGSDLNVDIGQGTCTIKYSPKINDQLIEVPELRALHPAQDPADTQGALETIWRLERLMAEISGMDAVSLASPGGSAGIWTNIAMIRAYHASRGEAEQRDEVITTIFSHPSNAAAAKVAGYKVITIYPDADGYPDLAALKAALSERTAAIMVTNPEDTGIYNPAIKEWVDAAHEVGALASYDQANAAGILGITRARDAGFDVCQFNLHKTFSAPHGSGGPGAAANAVSAALAPFLPGPRVERVDGRFVVREPGALSIGHVAPAHGVILHVVRAYAWIMALGAEGMLEASRIAVLNNNYLLKKVLEIPGASAPYATGRRRIEQVRYSWQELFEETGISSEEIGIRMADYGFHYWTSHHPYVVPQPFTLEPTECYSKAEIDEYVAALAQVAQEARENPELVRTAPHNQTVHHTHHDDLDDPERWAITWRAYRRKYFGEVPAGPAASALPDAELVVAEPVAVGA
ncbi:aminomethyl-transferring glycine dehydrogenase subunit GcvPB [Microbacterium sp. Au-Mic1]|uniref:aminomethyl-transferring glycine dehydrogenase subunit GcvPB n=1 Tax=Microbacterium sp. Au-Mic1 TaxID=2906457 RepID=UPI001E45B345|nr:aminomethyl-transferring glycine dehydrogenase subunit GcvPB [Microbacterium sp. Au-Mic1]MCE4026695.1 aminomethyl-transferring glycine dehydrogenase subunit GcvPB [Microbacterium sp. Au-Mic1]